MNNTLNIFWFRRDLRLNDNHALFEALKAGLPVLPIFIFDTEVLKEFPWEKDKRLTFIYKALENIHLQLKKKGSSLLIKKGNPVDVIQKLCEEYSISKVFCNDDYEPYARQRDLNVLNMLKERGVDFLSFKDQVIFEKDEILSNDEKPYTVFTPYMKKWKSLLSINGVHFYDSENKGDGFFAHTVEMPSLESVGYQLVDVLFPVSEIKEHVIKNYHLTRDVPSLENGTSLLGIHLRFGTVSVRHAVKMALQWNEVWLNELIWREFFMQIVWHFPKSTVHNFRRKYDGLQWRNNEEEFDKWCKGETGFPLVDAGIKQLIHTGYMHNRVRMVVANFLTKLLLIEWQWGERFFAQHLLDYELSSNCGNWQWAAGTGADAAPYFRIFNPMTQIERFDKNEKYVSKWVDIHSSDYPKPMINYEISRKRCLDVFKQL
jgi:deoxyribodipyrimidine photo-lyase